MSGVGILLVGLGNYFLPGEVFEIETEKNLETSPVQERYRSYRR